MKRRLDLLPPDLRRRLLLGRAAKRWLCVAAAVLAPLLAACGSEYRGLLADRAAVQDRLRRYRDVLAVQDAIRGIHAETEALRLRVERLRIPDGRPGPLAVIGLIGRAADETRGDVQVRQLSVVAAAPTADARPGAKAVAPPAGSVSVTVAGIGRDDAGIARFVGGLHRTGGFDSVELKSSSAQSAGGATVRSFRVDCVLEGAAR